MAEFNQLTVIEELKRRQITEKWVLDARQYSATLKALVDGTDFDKLLIEEIEKIESKDRAKARRKYAKDIRDVFVRILKKRENVFQASGGSEEIKIEGKIKDDFIDALTHFKGGKSINKYLSEYYFRQLDTDPNGLIFLEYKTDPKLKIYPTYKSIQDIRYYSADGQKCEYLIFEPKSITKAGGIEQRVWRFVDDKTDWKIIQTGNTFIVDVENSFEHPFGEVPGVILSDYLKVGYRDRLSPINPIYELAKDYARDKSILTIYKFLNGFPKHWQYVTQCRTCHGVGFTGSDRTTCQSCNGTGILQKNDVTDRINIATPKEGDPVIAPDIAGYISPDLATWERYNEDLKHAEEVMERTIWGTVEIKGKNETATGRFIDIQPITNELNRLSDTVEWIHNTLANWVANAIDPLKAKDEPVFHKAYGRRFIIEGPDVILERYEKAKEQGDSNTILDKLLFEFILSKYKNDPYMQSILLKKMAVEPFIHNSIDQVNTIFGAEQALKKVLFSDFWNQANHDKDTEVLKSEFDAYFEANKGKYLTTQPINQ